MRVPATGVSAPSRPALDVAGTFARDVREGLGRSPKEIPPRHLYDALGSALFEAIRHLPWYPISRAETALLARHGSAIVERLGGAAALVDLGCGGGDKTALLARAAGGRGGGPTVHLVDVSSVALETAETTLRPLPGVDVRRHQAEWIDGLRAAARAWPPGAPALVLFLGSNIGNLHAAEARRFLADVGAELRPGDGLLLGTDLVKPETVLRLAYDDPLGVTAAFNKNLLVRINRELEGEFDVTAFEHRAVWDAGASRVEMHLVSAREQVVAVPGAACTAVFRRGESVWTESSYKYPVEEVSAMGAAAALAARGRWLDREAGFALTLFERA